MKTLRQLIKESLSEKSDKCGCGCNDCGDKPKIIHPKLNRIIKEVIDESLYHTVYKTSGKLATLRTYNISDILSDIRALLGITIVKSTDIGYSDDSSKYEYTFLTIKIDPYVFTREGEKFDESTIQSVIDDIKSVKGVVSFKAEPKLEKAN
jgi:hypothetical protein